MSEAEGHDRRIASVLAQRAAARGYQLEATTTYTPLDALLALDRPEDLERDGLTPADEARPDQRGAVFRATMDFFFADGPHPGCVLRRVFALAKGLRREDLLLGMSAADIGKMFGETRAAQSWRINKIFTDYQKERGVKGFKAAFQKSESARGAYSRAQRGNTNRRGTGGRRRDNRKAA